MSYKRLLSISIVCISLATAALAGPFTSVIVYGDSLSDNGNLYAASGQPPSPPYFNGRRSNGPVAVEDLANALGAPLKDYAWIGATTGIGNYGDGGTPTSFGAFNLPGMLTEFNLTKASLGPVANSLFIVWGGANDFLAPSPVDATAQAVINRAITNLLTIVGSLESLGASHIIVPGLPDIGLTPYYQSLGPVAAAQGSLLTDAFNAALKANLPGNAIYVDTASLIRSMVVNPSAFGFTNVTSACFNGVTVCADPSKYLFFDDFHPTAATHAFVAAELMGAAVPEPATVFLVLAGLGSLALARRRSH
jgi:phospholipase/lecithinase/hemolysin